MEEEKVKFNEKYKQPIFAITKITYLIWTIFLAGALDKWKSDVVEANDSLIYYAIFWALLAGVGGLFAVFWSTNNNDDIASILETVQSTIIFPIVFVYIILITLLATLSPRLDIATTIFLTAIPVTIGLFSAWKMSIKNSGVLIKLKSTFIST